MCVLVVAVNMACLVSVVASPTTTANISSVVQKQQEEESIMDETEPCSQERMIVCYSSVGAQFSADVDALLPNLTDVQLDRYCQYVNHDDDDDNDDETLKLMFLTSVIKLN